MFQMGHLGDIVARDSGLEQQLAHDRTALEQLVRPAGFGQRDAIADPRSDFAAPEPVDNSAHAGFPRSDLVCSLFHFQIERAMSVNST
jgi:hypothetical protein